MQRRHDPPSGPAGQAGYPLLSGRLADGRGCVRHGRGEAQYPFRKVRQGHVVSYAHRLRLVEDVNRGEDGNFGYRGERYRYDHRIFPGTEGFLSQVRRGQGGVRAGFYGNIQPASGVDGRELELTPKG